MSEEDYEAVVPRIERFPEGREAANIMIELRAFEGIGAGAVLDDLCFSLKHLNAFSRIAVVTDAEWQETMADLSEVFTKAEVRTFAPEQHDAAERWLKHPRVGDWLSGANLAGESGVVSRSERRSATESRVEHTARETTTPWKMKYSLSQTGIEGAKKLLPASPPSAR